LCIYDWSSVIPELWSRGSQGSGWRLGMTMLFKAAASKVALDILFYV
jgi:hypothetical protein